MHVIPKPPGKHRVVLASLPQIFDLYKKIVKQMQAIPNVKVIRIEQIRNPGLEDLYHGMKKLIQSQCEDGNVNERDLFHGTKGNAIDGIQTYGYDDRYTGANVAKGDWGEYIECCLFRNIFSDLSNSKQCKYSTVPSLRTTNENLIVSAIR